MDTTEKITCSSLTHTKKCTHSTWTNPAASTELSLLYSHPIIIIANTIISSSSSFHHQVSDERRPTRPRPTSKRGRTKKIRFISVSSQLKPILCSNALVIMCMSMSMKLCIGLNTDGYIFSCYFAIIVRCTFSHPILSSLHCDCDWDCTQSVYLNLNLF